MAGFAYPDPKQPAAVRDQTGEGDQQRDNHNEHRGRGAGICHARLCESLAGSLPLPVWH